MGEGGKEGGRGEADSTPPEICCILKTWAGNHVRRGGGVPFPQQTTAAVVVDQVREVIASHATLTTATGTRGKPTDMMAAAVVGDQAIEVPCEIRKKAKGGGSTMKNGTGNGVVLEMTVPKIETAMGIIGVLVALSGGQGEQRTSQIFTPKRLRDGATLSSQQALLRTGPTCSGTTEAFTDPPTLAARPAGGVAAVAVEQEKHRSTVPQGMSCGLSTA